MSKPADAPGEVRPATWAGFILMCLGMFMAILDIQVVATSLPRIQDALARLPASSGKHGPQHLMPPRHIGQRRAQRGNIQVPRQPQHHRDVIGRGRAFQLGQEPQPLLRE